MGRFEGGEMLGLQTRGLTREVLIIAGFWCGVGGCLRNVLVYKKLNIRESYE